MRTAGVDVAANPRNTSVCVIDWARHDVRIDRRPAPDETLVEVITAVDRTALDVPLGWPETFVEAICAHHHFAPWPVRRLDPPDDRRPLRFRLTDRELMALGERPLSVSSDRIGVPAMRAARLQSLLAARGVPIDRSGLTGKILETYPAAALRAWGFRGSGYKGRGRVGVLGALVRELVRRCGPLRPAVERSLIDGDDHDLDAFVCAVVAGAAARGLTTGPDAGQLAAAAREGWIHLPRAGIEEIVVRGLRSAQMVGRPGRDRQVR
jgi:predicted nuclease with RNAse H fold